MSVDNFIRYGFDVRHFVACSLAVNHFELASSGSVNDFVKAVSKRNISYLTNKLSGSKYRQPVIREMDSRRNSTFTDWTQFLSEIYVSDKNMRRSAELLRCLTKASNWYTEGFTSTEIKRYIKSDVVQNYVTEILDNIELKQGMVEEDIVVAVNDYVSSHDNNCGVSSFFEKDEKYNISERILKEDIYMTFGRLDDIQVKYIMSKCNDSKTSICNMREDVRELILKESKEIRKQLKPITRNEVLDSYLRDVSDELISRGIDYNTIKRTMTVIDKCAPNGCDYDTFMDLFNKGECEIDEYTVKVGKRDIVVPKHVINIEGKLVLGDGLISQNVSNIYTAREPRQCKHGKSKKAEGVMHLGNYLNETHLHSCLIKGDYDYASIVKYGKNLDHVYPATFKSVVGDIWSDEFVQYVINDECTIPSRQLTIKGKLIESPECKLLTSGELDKVFTLPLNGTDKLEIINKSGLHRSLIGLTLYYMPDITQELVDMYVDELDCNTEAATLLSRFAPNGFDFDEYCTLVTKGELVVNSAESQVGSNIIKQSGCIISRGAIKDGSKENTFSYKLKKLNRRDNDPILVSNDGCQVLDCNGEVHRLPTAFTKKNGLECTNDDLVAFCKDYYRQFMLRRSDSKTESSYVYLNNVIVSKTANGLPYAVVNVDDKNTIDGCYRIFSKNLASHICKKNNTSTEITYNSKSVNLSYKASDDIYVSYRTANGYREQRIAAAKLSELHNSYEKNKKAFVNRRSMTFNSQPVENSIQLEV